MNAIKLVFYCAAAVMCVSVAVAALSLARLFESAGSVVAEVPGIVDSQATALRSDVAGELKALNTVLDSRTSAALDKMDRRMGMVQDDLSRQAGDAIEKLDTRLGAITSDASDAMTNLSRTSDAATETLREATGTIGELRPQIVGFAKDARLTAAEAGRAAGTIQRAMPELTAGVEKLVANSNQVTASSARAAQQSETVLRNFATATKPLPLPARLFFQVAPPLAGFAAGIASTYSVLH